MRDFGRSDHRYVNKTDSLYVSVAPDALCQCGGSYRDSKKIEPYLNCFVCILRLLRAADQLKKDAEFLKEQKAVYLKQNGYPANYLELQYVCPDCKDTGYADGKKCHCFKHMEIEILYDQSNIREVLERENFDTLSMAYYDRDHVDEKTGMTVYDYMSKVIRECREYVEKFKMRKEASCLPEILAAERHF